MTCLVRHAVIVLLLIICGVIFPAVSQAKTQTYYDFSAKYLSDKPGQHPRIYIRNRIPALQTLYNTVPQLEAVYAFKHHSDE